VGLIERLVATAALAVMSFLLKVEKLYGNLPDLCTQLSLSVFGLDDLHLKVCAHVGRTKQKAAQRRL
jgi:hypothetical protein